MKLNSKKCRKLLSNYEVQSEIDRLAVEVLLTDDKDVVDIPGILELDDTQIDDLASSIRIIRNNLGIKN